MFKITDVSKIAAEDKEFRVYKNVLISGNERLEFFINSFLHDNLLCAVLEGDKVSFLWKEFIPEEYVNGKRIEFSYIDILDNNKSLLIDEFRVRDSLLV